jgi:hypothetical protein
MQTGINKIKEALYNLSLEYETLSNVYPDFVDVLDEVVGDFDESFKLLPILLEQDTVPIKALIEILKCKNLIDLIFTMEDKLSDECFRTCNEWNQRNEASEMIRGFIVSCISNFCFVVTNDKVDIFKYLAFLFFR